MSTEDGYTQGMGYVPALEIERDRLVSNVPASTLPPWDGGASYALGAEVMAPDTRIVYRSLADHNVGNPISDETKWQNRGVENRLAMFDRSLATATSNPELIEVRYPPGKVVTDVILFEVSAHAVQVLMLEGEGDAEELRFDSGDISILKPSGNSHWGYFFEPLERESRVHITGLPAITQATLVLRIKAPGGTARCGEALIGRAVWLGNTYWRPAVGYDEWGEKVRDPWGGWRVSPDAPYSDRLELQVLVEGVQYERTRQRVLAVRRQPVVWIGAVGLPVLMTLGYITLFKQVLVNHGISDCQMTIEGLEISDE